MLSTFTFTLSTPISPASRFSSRLGTFYITRQNPRHDSDSNPKINAGDLDVELKFDTPGLLIPTSRGVVRHLSRDHCRITNAIKFVNVPFETFLEQSPPLPTLQPNAKHRLHKFLGFLPSQHVLSMSARDPHDAREMPPNGNAHITVSSLRGVRKITPAEWSTYTQQCKPDIVFALSDIPFTNPPYSQKRLTKSIERSAAWLAQLLHPQALPITAPNASDAFSIDTPSNTQDVNGYYPNVFLQLAGSTSLPARRAFADSLIEPLHGNEANAMKPLRCLDDGVRGYVFDLVPLRIALAATKSVQPIRDQEPENQLPNSKALLPLAPGISDLSSSAETSNLTPLFKASLASLPLTKPRVVNSPRSPHEMLHLISEVGIDVFDAQWALDAANIGVALDFVFPAARDFTRTGKARNGKWDLGHNLYEKEYELDFGSLAGSLRSSLSVDASGNSDKPVCPCGACSPVRPQACDRIIHAPSDMENNSKSDFQEIFSPPYTRAYIHHLLHTHEMAAHTWLVMHNIAVLDAFMGGVRQVLRVNGDEFARETARFEATYDEGIYSDQDGKAAIGTGLFDNARRCWKEVELARGKGRLGREKTS